MSTHLPTRTYDDLKRTAARITREEIATANCVQILPYKVTILVNRTVRAGYTNRRRVTRYRVKADRTEVATGLTKREAEKLAGFKYQEPSGKSHAPLLRQYVSIRTQEQLTEALAQAERFGGNLYQVTINPYLFPGQLGDFHIIAPPSEAFQYDCIYRRELDRIPEGYELVSINKVD